MYAISLELKYTQLSCTIDLKHFLKIKTMKKILTCIVLSLSLNLGFSAHSFAGFYDMEDVEQHFNEYKKAKSADEALTALFHMKNATIDCWVNLPPKLNQLNQYDPKVLAYRATIDRLLEQVYLARQLVLDGKFNEAQKLAKKMEEIKKEGHKKFK